MKNIGKKWLCFFTVISLFITQLFYCPDLFSKQTRNFSSKKTVKKNVKKKVHKDLQQVAAFKIKKKAERFVKKLRKDGLKAVIRKGVTKDKTTVYRVYVEKRNKAPRAALSYSVKKRDTISKSLPIRKERIIKEKLLPLEDKSTVEKEVSAAEVEPLVEEKPLPVEEKLVVEEKPLTVEDKFVVKEKIPLKEDRPFIEEKPSLIEDKPHIVKEEPLPAEEKPPVIKEKISTIEDKPIGRERISGDVFGRKGGYLHPFLSITEYYTDNVFYSNDNKESDFITVISPGIWLAVPRVYERLLKISTSSMAPGGLSLSRYKPDVFRRYQTFLLYNAYIEQFSKYSSEDEVIHKAEGLFQYNLRGGLSMELTGQFLDSHDDKGTGISTELDKFRSYLSNLILTYDVSKRFKFRIDYSNFLVNYDASRNNFRDRADNAFSGYVFYKFKPKTSLFIEYEFIDIKYREEILTNSKEHHYFGGLQWDITAKSKGSVKAGYGVKDFVDSDIGGGKDFILEAQIDHQFTPKTSLILKASRKTNETNISTTDYVLSNTVEVEYLQRFTGKITSDINLSYTSDEYKNELTYNGKTKKLEDDYFRGAFALQYNFREWLQSDLGYIYTKRSSSFSDFDYTNNVFFIRIKISL